jgi:hypothetical protein
MGESDHGGLQSRRDVSGGRTRSAGGGDSRRWRRGVSNCSSAWSMRAAIAVTAERAVLARLSVADARRPSVLTRTSTTRRFTSVGSLFLRMAASDPPCQTRSRCRRLRRWATRWPNNCLPRVEKKFSTPSTARTTTYRAATVRERNKVYLVGAGPGDPDLITWKGRKLLAIADSILYDNLANEHLLDLAPKLRAHLRRQKEIGTRVSAGRNLRHADRSRAPRPQRGAPQRRRPVHFRTRRRRNGGSGRRPAFRSKWCPASLRLWESRPIAAFRSRIASTTRS